MSLELFQRAEYRLGRNQVRAEYIGPRKSVARARPNTVKLDTEPSCPGPTLAELARLDTGEVASVQVGRYQLERLLGRGGMAAVYRGVDTALGRAVAVKILTRDLVEQPDALARFMNEAQLSAGMSHANVVEVFDFGTTPEGMAYIVMQLWDGEDLRTTLTRETSLTWPRALGMSVQLCHGLEAIHARGIVHRDVKPANCLLVRVGDEERVVLTDFGIACRTGRTDRVVVGTPEYMSPEQARGDAVDARSDVYSLGIMVGELLTGRLPFSGKSVAAILDAQIHEPTPELVQTGPIVPGLAALYARALAKRPRDRFASVAEFEAALLAIDTTMAEWRTSQHARPLDIDAEITLVGRPFAC